MIHSSVKTYSYCEIGSEVNIGENSVIGSHCVILGEVNIGKNVRIQSFCFIPSGTTIEDNVFLAMSVIICNDKNPPSHGEDWRPVMIKEGAVIGANCTILPGVTVGKNVKVGAGTLITQDVPDDMIVYNEIKRIEKHLNSF
jgi:acetyltransferase-like isoleucine patch superfamily enzyme